MKTKSILLSIFVLAAMVLSACGPGEETSTFEPATDLPPATQETLEATEMPSGTETLTGDNLTTTPEIPVTGTENPARLSNMLDFNVWNQNGEEIGEVNDMVIDVDNAAITYVIVGTGGFLEIGEKDILVPWESLTLQLGDGSTTGGQQNAFILQSDQEVFNNFPDMDWKSNFPNVGDPSDDWDVDIRNYWEGGVVPGTGTAEPDGTGTPAAEGTAIPDATGTSAPDVSATATGTTGQGEGQVQGLGTRLQGVVLASDVLGSTLNLSGMMNAGEGQGQATATSDGTGVAQATATSDGTGAQATATTDGSGVPQATATVGTGVGPGTGNVTGTIEDVIVDVETGDVQYLVINTSFDDGEHWIPVPLGLLQWNGASQNFVLDTDGDRLRNAPFFTEDEFPDTTTSGWDTEFSTYWQNDGTGTGGGTEGNATATPTP
jgi:sporulation protein YlmC with PRC-barrel domain